MQKVERIVEQLLSKPSNLNLKKAFSYITAESNILKSIMSATAEPTFSKENVELIMRHCVLPFLSADLINEYSALFFDYYGLIVSDSLLVHSAGKEKIADAMIAQLIHHYHSLNIDTVEKETGGEMDTSCHFQALFNLLEFRNGLISFDQLNMLLLVTSLSQKKSETLLLLQCLHLIASQNFILLLNHSILLEFMLKIILFTFKSSTLNAARITLLVDLLRGHAKASQLPSFISKCIEMHDSSEISESIFLDEVLGREFGIIVYGMVSAQAMDLIQALFQKEMAGLALDDENGPDIDGVKSKRIFDESEEKADKKQRKKKSKKQKDHEKEPAAKTNNELFTKSKKIASFLFTHAIINIKVNETKQLPFQEFTHKFHTTYLEPLLDGYTKQESTVFLVQEIIQPSLESHLILLNRQPSYCAQFGSVETTYKLVDIFGKPNHKHKKDLTTVLLEIACFVLEKAPKHSLADDHIKKLIVWIWSVFESKNVQSLQKTVIDTFIPALLYFSSTDQATFYLKSMIASALRYPLETSHSAILLEAGFYEIHKVQSLFISCLFQVLAADYDEFSKCLVAISSSGEGSSDCFSREMMKPLIEATSTSLKSRKRSKKSEKDSSVEVDTDSVEWIERVARILSSILVGFPKLFQTELIQYYLAHVLIKNYASPTVPILGSLLYKYIERRKDRSVVFSHPSLVLFYARSFRGQRWVQGIVEICARRLVLVGSSLSGRMQKHCHVELEEFFEALTELFESEDVDLLAAFWKGVSYIDPSFGIHHPKMYSSLTMYWKKCWTRYVCTDLKGLDMLVESLTNVYQHLSEPLPMITVQQDIRNWIDINQDLNEVAQKGYGVLLGYFCDLQNEKSLIQSWMSKFLDTFSTPIAFGTVEPKISKILIKCNDSIYEIIFLLILERIENSLSKMAAQSGEAMVILVQSLMVFIKTPHPSSAGRRIIYKNWGRVCANLSKIIYQTGTIPLIDACFSLLTFVTKDKSFELSVAELSLMLSAIPSFETNISSHVLQSQIPQIMDCFNMVYNLLYAILRHRREEMISLIPQFFCMITNLIECFTITDGIVHSVGYSKTFLGKVSMRPLALCAPLPSNYSNQITRLFLQMTVKSTSSTNPNFNCVKPFAKYAPFLLTQLLAIPTSTRWNISTDEWKEWCFVCLDLCDDHGREMVLASLNHGSILGLRVVYKNIVGEWENHHRYKGSRT